MRKGNIYRILFFSIPLCSSSFFFSFPFDVCMCVFIYISAIVFVISRKKERKKQNKTNRMRDNNMNTKMTNDRMEKKTLSFISSFCALILVCECE